MAQSSDDRASTPDFTSATGDGSELHNSVLIRSSKPVGANHSWVAPAVLGVALVVGAVVWGVVATHPPAPVVNHAVAAAPTSFTPTGPG
jgi:hypothetical protein